MPIILARERVPREFPIDARHQKFDELRPFLSEMQFERLHKSSLRYEKRWDIEPIT